MIDALLKEGAQVVAFDPEAMPNVKKQLGNIIEYVENQYEALNDADALVIATEWSEFRTPDFEKLNSMMKKKVVFDGRNLFDVQKMKELDFYYVSIGRKLVGS